MKLNLDHLTHCYLFTLMLLLCKTIRRIINPMRLKITIIVILFLVFIPTRFSHSGADFPVNAGDVVINLNESDSTFITGFNLVYFFDLRERETYIQFTYVDNSLFDEGDVIPGSTGLDATAHVQIFNVNNNCNENNFFDVYTPKDTHVYNMRDIQTNDGNPSGVVLPPDAYGMVVISSLRNTAGDTFRRLADPIGNFRILDDNGYEYRTNAQAFFDGFQFDVPPELLPFIASTFNFNTKGGVSLSDIVGIVISIEISGNPPFIEWVAQPVQGIYSPFDIDILDNNETIFSCRDVIFSCVNEDNPLLEELLSVAGTASVASFEYGINNAIPHSKGGELLCPGNNISEGIVRLLPEPYSQAASDILQDNNLFGPFFLGYVGLNNGNGRGSIDSLWTFNFEID